MNSAQQNALCGTIQQNLNQGLLSPPTVTVSASPCASAGIIGSCDLNVGQPDEMISHTYSDYDTTFLLNSVVLFGGAPTATQAVQVLCTHVQGNYIAP
jgi:hypothetical protein